jgi:hypothetical protein
MPDLTLIELQQQIGALVMQLWQQGKMIADLQQQVAALALNLTQPKKPEATT